MIVLSSIVSRFRKKRLIDTLQSGFWSSVYAWSWAMKARDYKAAEDFVNVASDILDIIHHLSNGSDGFEKGRRRKK